jgi:hypothetical protein
MTKIFTAPSAERLARTQEGGRRLAAVHATERMD